MGLFTPLFAGTATKGNDTCSPAVTRVGSVKIRYFAQSAGNPDDLPWYSGSSETIRSETIENVKPISIHVPRHIKPDDDESFGHYLAGLIDGDAKFYENQELIIGFPGGNGSLAHYVKKHLGFGRIHMSQN